MKCKRGDCLWVKMEKSRVKEIEKKAKMLMKLDNKKTEFNEDITFYAFRYALGRMTYAVGEVVDYLIENWNKLQIQTKEKICIEIDKAIIEKRAGMECDVEQWQRILDKVKSGNISPPKAEAMGIRNARTI